MKKRIVLFIFIVTSVFNISASDKAEVWSRLYKRSFLPELKYAIMLNIVELNDRAMIPLLEEILSNDIIANLNNKRSVTEERDFIELTKLVVSELGELKAKSSSSLVYTIAEETSDPLLKAEAVIALGNMRANNYIDEISLILRNINLRPVKGLSAELEAESKIAYGSIAALDRFRNIQGYSSVFFASVGWYDQRVRFFADKVLKTIVENPVEALIPIITDGSFSDKDKAISEVQLCNAPEADKAKAAREALKQGFGNIPESIQEGMILTTIRKKAVRILISTRSKDPLDVSYLSEAIRDGADLEEKLYAIKALGLNGSDEAIEGLVSRLSYFNERSMNGLDISYAEQDLIKAIVITLGDTKNNKASAVLTEVQYSNFSTGIVRAAKESLKKLN